MAEQHQPQIKTCDLDASGLARWIEAESAAMARTARTALADGEQQQAAWERKARATATRLADQTRQAFLHVYTLKRAVPDCVATADFAPTAFGAHEVDTAALRAWIEATATRLAMFAYDALAASSAAGSAELAAYWDKLAGAIAGCAQRIICNPMVVVYAAKLADPDYHAPLEVVHSGIGLVHEDTRYEVTLG